MPIRLRHSDRRRRYKSPPLGRSLLVPKIRHTKPCLHFRSLTRESHLIEEQSLRYRLI